MIQRQFSIAIVCLLTFFVMAHEVHAQEKITGPWLWMIAPTVPNRGGAASIDIDSLAIASGGAVTEADVAANGAREGDRVGNFVWTLGKIPIAGGNNINETLNRIGMTAGNVDDHSSYALLMFKSDTARNNVTMRVGSDDAIKVWLNGAVVHNNPVNRGASDFQDVFLVDLVAGDNLLMVKVSERGGGWSMFVGIDTVDSTVNNQGWETNNDQDQRTNVDTSEPSGQRPIVRLIYFLPRDRTPQPDIDEKMDRMIKDVQRFYADGMEAHGFGRKTFLFETDAQGKAVVHHVRGNSDSARYHTDSGSPGAEVRNWFDVSKNIYFIAVDLSIDTIGGWDNDSGVCGIGLTHGMFGGEALIVNSDICSTGHYGFYVAAHELGHAFGLGHDFRNNYHIMSYGTGPDVLSKCSAEWLDVHRAFNPDQSAANRQPKIEMFPPRRAEPTNAIEFRFKVSDPDGLHQVQLHTPDSTSLVQGGLLGCKRVNGVSDTVEFVTTELIPRNTSVYLQVIDVNGNFSRSDHFRINISSLLPPAKTVSIPDRHLAEAVRREVGSLTTHALLNLRRLEARNRGIKDLTGLEHARHLRYLDLTGEYISGEGIVNSNAVSDVTPLAGLTQLATLLLSNNRITDVTPLAALTQLTLLYLADNRITDVSPLADLTRLTALNLSSNRITDVSPLAELTALKQLYLNSNSIADMSPLTDFTRLITLGLDNNGITDVSPLTSLTQLTTLWLGNNGIVDVKPLAKLTQLKTLYLGGNSITDVSPLVALNLTGTEWDSTGLSLYGNQLGYPSIYTHIPAMQAKGIEVRFQSRTPTTLRKISGDAQQSTVNAALALPFVVEVWDQFNRAYAEVPVTFTITEGTGKLSTKTAATDTNGKAQTRLTLGRTEGTTTIRGTAPKIAKPVTFTAKAISFTASLAFPDANLRAKITETLGKPTGGTLTVTDLLTLTALTATDANIQDLTGLQHATNLATLSLDDNNISDVTPLTPLSKLTTLSLNNNALSNVEPLTGLTHLKTLRLRGNLLSYPSLHTHIPALQAGGTTVAFDRRTPTTFLKVSGDQGAAGGAISVVVEVRDEKGAVFVGVPVTFTVTAGGGRLARSNTVTDATGRARTTLTLGTTPGKNTFRVTAAKGARPASFTVTAIDPNTRVTIRDANLRAKITGALGKPSGGQLTAKDMLGLTRLAAPNANIRDLTGLEHARNLQTLNLGGEYIQGEGTFNNNAISDFSPLQALAQLTILNLSFSSLSDISFLSPLTQLRTLYLWDNSITDVSPLAELTALTQLYLNNNTITDVSPLAGLTQLMYLFLNSNSITDVSPLARFTQLKHLYLDNNDITDIAPLAKLTQLEILRLGGNDITDVSPLAGLTQLTRLYLSNNTIIDVSPLAELTALTQLYLDRNSITDVSPLVALNLTGTEWNDTGLSLYNNPLSYASINTHIAAMQAKGIVVKFFNRAQPVLLMISGDAQEGFVGNSLAAPFIVEARDERGKPMRGVSVKFTMDTGEGTLDPTTAKTDAEGRAQTTLILDWTPGTYTLRATATGIRTYVQFTVTATVMPNRLATDVNGDGDVDVEDLLLVAASFGPAPPPGTMPDTDVNDDGEINDADVILVLAALESAPAAPPLDAEWTAASLQRWIGEARQHNSTDAAFRRGIVVLEQLLATFLPKEIALLANYPNPFNPETWIPYQLAESAEVTLTIYTVNGTVVRTLALGHQPAGIYVNRSRAVYWDGKNEIGEPVASGVYFYTLTADDFTATRKMLIRK